jgi:hypothetical protein
LDCGQEDAREICLADLHEDDCKRTECVNGECREPGSNRCNPYIDMAALDGCSRTGNALNN